VRFHIAHKRSRQVALERMFSLEEKPCRWIAIFHVEPNRREGHEDRDCGSLQTNGPSKSIRDVALPCKGMLEEPPQRELRSDLVESEVPENHFIAILKMSQLVRLLFEACLGVVTTRPISNFLVRWTSRRRQQTRHLSHYQIGQGLSRALVISATVRTSMTHVRVLPRMFVPVRRLGPTTTFPGPPRGIRTR
jgi:hypothetical protein